MSLPIHDPALLGGYAQGYGARKGYDTKVCDLLAKNFLAGDPSKIFLDGPFGMVTTALECFIDGHFLHESPTPKEPVQPKEDSWVGYVRKR